MNKNESIITEYMAARGIIASRKYPIVYVNLPKCSCTTIKNILFILDYQHQYVNPLNIHRALKNENLLINFQSPIELKNAIAHRKIAFTFVRHPLKRAYSCFNEKIYHQSPFSFSKLRNEYLKDEYKIIFPKEKNYSLDQHRNNFKSFLLFVRDNISGFTKFRKDPHWLPQTRLLDGYNKFTAIDFIGRLERYESDFLHVLNVIGIEDPLSLTKLKYNEGDTPPFRYDEIICDDLITLGHEIYASDYQKLGYGNN